MTDSADLGGNGFDFIDNTQVAFEILADETVETLQLIL